MTKLWKKILKNKVRWLLLQTGTVGLNLLSNRFTDRWNRTKSPEWNLHEIGSMNLWKEWRQYNDTQIFSTNHDWTNTETHKKIHLGIDVLLCTKIHFTEITDLNLEQNKTKTKTHWRKYWRKFRHLWWLLTYATKA